MAQAMQATGLRGAIRFLSDIARRWHWTEEGVESHDKRCAEPLFPWQNFGIFGRIAVLSQLTAQPSGEKVKTAPRWGWRVMTLLA
jgi:hypothetical protein